MLSNFHKEISQYTEILNRCQRQTFVFFFLEINNFKAFRFIFHFRFSPCRWYQIQSKSLAIFFKQGRSKGRSWLIFPQKKIIETKLAASRSERDASWDCFAQERKRKPVMREVFFYFFIFVISVYIFFVKYSAKVFCFCR